MRTHTKVHPRMPRRVFVINTMRTFGHLSCIDCELFKTKDVSRSVCTCVKETVREKVREGSPGGRNETTGSKICEKGRS